MKHQEQDLLVLFMLLLLFYFYFILLLVLFNLQKLFCSVNPYLKEQTYVILSLSAKLLLGWMIFSNVLILGN